MSATQRKVRSHEHDDLCFLREKPCQSVDQATNKLHNQIRGTTYISGFVSNNKTSFAHVEALLFPFIKVLYEFRLIFTTSQKLSSLLITNFISISYRKFLFNLITSFKIKLMYFTFKKNNKQTKKPVNRFLQDGAAGVQSLQTSIEIKLCQSPWNGLYFVQ